MTTILLTLSLLLAHDRGANQPYISTDDGLFYARCVPADQAGPAGTTVVSEVGRETDRVIDRYDWYSREHVRLGYSAITGKVAVASQAQVKVAADPNGEPAILSFYSGGKLLHAYTVADLKPLGLGEFPLVDSNGRYNIIVGPMEYLLLDTNRRFFPVQFGRTKEPARFDIDTGKPMTP